MCILYRHRQTHTLIGKGVERHKQNHASASMHSLFFSLTKLPLCFQGVKELCSLLQHQALLLPSLKLLLESRDEHLHAMALDHITAIAKVLPAEFLSYVSEK